MDLQDAGGNVVKFGHGINAGFLVLGTFLSFGLHFALSETKQDARGNGGGEVNLLNKWKG